MTHLGGPQSDRAIVETLQEIGQKAYQRGLCSANDGNFSWRKDFWHIGCTVSGTAKGMLGEKDFTVVDLYGNNLYPGKKPSTEILLHLLIYWQRKDVNVVLHLHSPYTLALSMLDSDFGYDIPLTAESILMWGRVPVIPFSLPGSREVPDKLAPYLDKCQIAVLAHHGVVAWGTDARETYFLIEALESYSYLYYQLYPYRESISTLSRNEVERLRSQRKKYFPDRRYLDDVPG